jgi:hypothetical protein
MRSGACMLDTYIRIAPTHILLDRILSQATWAALRSDEAIKARRRPPRDPASQHPCLQAASFSLAPGHRTSSLLATLLRFLQHAQFLLDQRCDSCLRFLAGCCAAAHGLRATCIRRAESSGGLLATSFGGLQHFHGPHILYGQPSSQFCVTFLSVFVLFMFDVLAHILIFGSVQHLYASYIYVLCLTASPTLFFGFPLTRYQLRQKWAQLIFSYQNYVSSAIHFVCIYTPCLYTRYT